MMITNLTNEVWLPVYQQDQYAFEYEVSNMGRVRNATRHRILKGTPVRNGHLKVCFYIGPDEVKYWYVGRVVLLSFLGPEEHKPYARHRNGVGNDNRLTNLVWSTALEVAEMRDWELDHHNKGERQSQAKYTWGQVERVRALYKQGMTPKQLRAMFPEIPRGAISRFLWKVGSWDKTQKEFRAQKRAADRTKIIRGAANDQTIH